MEQQKKWSKKYDHCLGCKTTKHKHNAWGLCIVCYMKWRRNDKVFKKKVIRNDYKYRRKNRKRINQFWREHYSSIVSPERAEYERERKRRWYYQKKAQSAMTKGGE